MTIYKMESWQIAFWLETIGGAIGLFFGYWFFIKPLFWKDKKLWQCEYCNKTFRKSEKCEKHERKCSKKSK